MNEWMNEDKVQEARGCADSEDETEGREINFDEYT